MFCVFTHAQPSVVCVTKQSPAQRVADLPPKVTAPQGTSLFEHDSRPHVEQPQPTSVPLAAAGTHVLFDGEHAVPAAQQVRLGPLPHGVWPAGQPQVPDGASAHAMPFWQQVDPHGVVPGAQQHDVLASVHVPLQQAVPH
jgi:hypothetical protein